MSSEGGAGADRWRRAGIDDAARATFESWKIELADAIQWRLHGVPDGLTATRWSVAQVTPEESEQWRAAGIDSVEALQWSNFSYDLAGAKHEKGLGHAPSTARMAASARIGPRIHPGGAWGLEVGPAFRKWLEQNGSGTLPVHLYLSTGWTTDEALPWAQAGIFPDNARVWMALGLRALEAARLEEQGSVASAIVAEWWGAAIPLEQVAAWLGAGFTADEAREQIAAGIDVERAAVLRALRDATED